MMKYKSLAFDLDDTLLDTSGLLVPEASRQACEAMIAAGLQCSLAECMSLRRSMAADHSHTEIFAHIANRFGATQKGKAIHDALNQFYNPAIPATLPLLPGSLENILNLKSKYNLFLVTMGSLKTQQLKIQALGIAEHFQKIYILNGFLGERKESAFRDIIHCASHQPQELLSIGNRLSSEIRDGKKIGADTCYFAFGEHLGEAPLYPEDRPDFTISHHQELIKTCGL